MTDTTGAGHGGKNEFDAGAVGSGTTERKEVLRLNQDLLKANPNWKDVSDYSGSTINENLYNIVAKTNQHGDSSDVTLSHHMNAYNGKATGVEVWYYAGDSVGRNLATKASAAISSALGLFNRGAKATTDLYVVSNTTPHCILVEWCFVDNPNDIAAWRKNRTEAVNAFARIVGMNGITGGTTSQPEVQPRPERPRHNILIGSFSDESAKPVEAYFKKKGLNITRVSSTQDKSRIWLQSGTYAQYSSTKREVLAWLEQNDMSYVVVLSSQVTPALNNWYA